MTRAAQIEADFSGWHAWQGCGRDGKPSPTSWVACLHDPTAGVDPTVVTDSADRLRAAPARQRDRAEGGATPLELLTEGL